VRTPQRKTLIPTFSREREKECAGADLPFLHPLSLAGEGRVRVFFLFFPD